MGSEREAQFRKLAADHPSSPMVHFSLGKLLLGERRYAEAVESLRTAVSLQKDYAAALVALGDALAGAGRRDEARQVLERLIGQSSDWARLDEYLVSFVVEPSLARTVFASSFASTLELVREGLMEVHQQAAFAPLYVRKGSHSGRGNGDADPSGVAAPL